MIERKQLAEIIAEEIKIRLAELHEAGKKKGREPETADAVDSPSPRGEAPPGPQVDVSPDEDEDDGAESEDEPEDPEDEAEDEQGIDADGNAGEEPAGAINNDIAGKVLQAISIEPQSKVLPGAKEIVISFNDSTDALRILVTPTGMAKFFWRGGLHDLP